MTKNIKSKNEIVKMISEVKSIIEKEGIDFWLDEGTLLGTIRNGDMIPGDGDIDFSFNHNNIGLIIKVCKELEKIGYNIKYQKNLPCIEDLIQVYTRSDIKMQKIHIDFNIYYENNYGEFIRRGIHCPIGKVGKLLIKISSFLTMKLSDERKVSRYIWRGTSLIRVFVSIILIKIYLKFCKSIWQVVPSNMFKKLIKRNFMNMEFMIPEPYEKYLEYRYGINWRIPDKNYNWTKSTDQAMQFNRLNSLKIKQIFPSKFAKTSF